MCLKNEKKKKKGAYPAHFKYFIFSDVISTSHRRIGIRRKLKVSKMEVVWLIDPCQTSNTKTSKVEDTRVTHEVDIGCNITTIIEFFEVVGGFVVTAYEQGRHRGYLLT